MNDFKTIMDILSKSSLETTIEYVDGIDDDDNHVETIVLNISDKCGCSVDLFFDKNNNIL